MMRVSQNTPKMPRRLLAADLPGLFMHYAELLVYCWIGVIALPLGGFCTDFSQESSVPYAEITAVTVTRSDPYVRLVCASLVSDSVQFLRVMFNSILKHYVGLILFFTPCCRGKAFYV